MLGAIIWACLVSVASAANVTYYQPNATLVPNPLPTPAAASDPDALVAAFNHLGRTTSWTLVQAIPFQGDTGEPEGIVRLSDDRYIVSAGFYTNATVAYGKDANGGPIVINGTDRTTGAGTAHFLVYDGNGTRLADATLTAPGDIQYHTGGIDYDGTYIWTTFAQYRPNTTATIARVDPTTMDQVSVANVTDHQGGVVHDTASDVLYTLNWGSRNATRFSAAGDSTYALDKVMRNPSYYVDYQDCKWIGHPAAYEGRATMLCSGVATIGSGNSSYNLGGIALVDCESMAPVAEVPIPMRSQLGQPITQNPMDVALVDGKLRFYWMPDQHNSTLYIYEAEELIYEYGGTGGGGSSYESWV